MEELLDRPVVIASRRSPLARRQAHEIADAIAAAHGWSKDEAAARIRVETYVTTGDIKASGPLSAIGGKGLFTKEVQAALLTGAADIAVHSLKDMPTDPTPGLALGPTPKRADPRDAFICRTGRSLADLPAGAIVGAAALRRTAQTLHRRPDLTVAPIRGNVQTRLSKLDGGEVAATYLAAAGLSRLGMLHEAAAVLEPEDMLPAVGQGALAIELRAKAPELEALVAPIACAESAVCTAAERAFLARLDGSCRMPIAGLARRLGDEVRFSGEVLAPDGSLVFTAERTFAWNADDLETPQKAGADAADEVRAAAGAAFFDALRVS